MRRCRGGLMLRTWMLCPTCSRLVELADYPGEDGSSYSLQCGHCRPALLPKSSRDAVSIEDSKVLLNLVFPLDRLAFRER